MKERVYSFLANSVFLLHLAVGVTIILGWLFPPPLKWIYRTTIIGTLFSELALGYCPLTRWEFGIRKKLSPHLNYDWSFFGYYGRGFFQKKINPKLIKFLALAFLISSLAVDIFLIRT